MAIYLKITEDTDMHSIRLGKRPIFIGRSSKCHITVKDTMVSGKHLAIKINDDSRVVIKDLDTTNGTYLNGSKVEESLLYLEDIIQVGRVKITLDSKEMSSNELKLHQRDFERTSVTFVKLGAHLNNDFDDDPTGVRKQKTLLAKVREKNKTYANTEIDSKESGENNELLSSDESKSIIFDKESSYNTIKKKQESIDSEQREVEATPKKKPQLQALSDDQIDELEEEPEFEENEDSNEYEFEYEEEEEDDSPSPKIMSKIKGLFKK